MSSPPQPNNNSLDDIFGSSPPPPTTQIHHPPPQSTTTVEPSELPSLHRQHVTAGYRDGISASKGEHVQAGFDAGFPVGAQLGMRAGAILGILEGILRGYESRAVVKKQPLRTGSAGSSTGATAESDEEGRVRAEKRERVVKLYQAAVRELDVRSVFAGMEGGDDDGSVKPEKRLRVLGDGVVSGWESKVPVAEWEGVMEALEMKEKEKETQEWERS